MLSDAQVAQYHGEGFTVYPDMQSRDVIASLLGTIDDVARGNTLAKHDGSRLEMEPDQPPDGTLIRRIYDPCIHYQPFAELSENDEVLDCVEQLIGPDLIFSQSKINMKLPRVGSPVEWHQDMAYGLLTNMNNLAILLYLDDADRSNGCLQVLPRAHKGRLLDHGRNGTFQGMVTEEMDDRDAVAVEGRAGTAVFLHCMMPHTSLPNRSDRPRRTLIWGYRAAHAFPVVTHRECDDAAERVVRGRRLDFARFEEMELAVPRYPEGGKTLYQLQERARKG